MEAVGKPSGLTRRKGSAAWYYRQRCPSHLKAPGVPEEVWISFGTADYQEAIKQLDTARDTAAHRFRGLAAEPTGIFPRTSRPQTPSDPKLPLLTIGHAAILARSLFQRALIELDLSTGQSGTLTSEQSLDLRSELQDRQQVLLGYAIEGEDDPVLGAQISVLRAAGLRSEPESEAGQLLREYLRRAMVQLGALRLARLDGDFTDRITDRLFMNGGIEAETAHWRSARPSVAPGATNSTWAS